MDCGKKVKEKGSRTWWFGKFSIYISRDTKIGRLTARNLCSEEKAKSVTGQLFASASEGLNGQVSHSSSLKRVGMWLMDPFSHLSRSQEWRWNDQERSGKDPLVWWNEFLWYTQEIHRVLENVIWTETLPAWNKRYREDETKEGYRTPQNSTGGNGMIKLPICKYAKPFKK